MFLWEVRHNVPIIRLKTNQAPYKNTCEASFRGPSLVVKHRVDGSQGTWRELVVIFSIAAGCAREHNIVAVLSKRRAYFGIVLEVKQT